MALHLFTENDKDITSDPRLVDLAMFCAFFVGESYELLKEFRNEGVYEVPYEARAILMRTILKVLPGALE